MKAMSKCLKFGKSVHDNGWGMFTTYLAYKLNEQGKVIKKVDKWYPSSKTCHVCGCKFDKLELKDRQWVCPECGTVHKRDENAAINILKEGLRLLIGYPRVSHGSDCYSSICVYANTTIFSSSGIDRFLE